MGHLATKLSTVVWGLTSGNLNNSLPYFWYLIWMEESFLAPEKAYRQRLLELKAVSSFQNGLQWQQVNSELGGGRGNIWSRRSRLLLQIEKVMLFLQLKCITMYLESVKWKCPSTDVPCAKNLLLSKHPFPFPLPLLLLIHSRRWGEVSPTPTLTSHAYTSPGPFYFFFHPSGGILLT